MELSDEAKRIYEEVERRKQRAKDLKVVELAFNVYEDTIYYPSWAKEKPDLIKRIPRSLLRGRWYNMQDERAYCKEA